MYNETYNTLNIDMAQVVGKGYGTFWKHKGRYRVVKGGRGSKKSTTTSLDYISKMMYYYHNYGLKPNVLVIRRYDNTNRDTTFAQLKWAINRLGVSKLWKSTTSPLELIYKPSGQKILFRGLDDPQSLTSITVADGQLCWVWFEEAFQVTNEDDFNKIDLSIRGELPDPLYKQITLTMNPWSEKTWIKKRFFDDTSDPRVLALTRNYDCNEFLTEEDLEVFEIMKIKNPKRFNIEGLGNWGISEGLIYDNFVEEEFDVNYLRSLSNNYTGRPRFKEYFGIDFGFSDDPTAFVACLVDEESYDIYIYDEIYKYHLTNQEIYNEIKYRGYETKLIMADSADPRLINEIRLKGLRNLLPVKKSTIESGIRVLQDYTIHVLPKCEKTLIEFNNYCWKVDKETGLTTSKPGDDFNHAMDALRYACSKIRKNSVRW